jgi:SAM-dependent methyltransferase
VPREQRLVFGEVAEAYQRARPTYPAAMFDALIAITGVVPRDVVLEIGAGTGKATESFLERGLRVTVCEPSAGMAKVLRARFPEITVHESGFEECPIEGGDYALIAAAQSWHWVDPMIGPSRVADALRPEGWIALFWNRPNLDGSAWHDEVQPIYERFTPHMTHEKIAKRVGGSLERAVVDLGRSGRFGPCRVDEFPWVARYTTAEYVDLLGTFSDHRVLPDEVRAGLHGAIGEWIDAHHGGVVEHPFVAELITAQRFR